MSCAPCGSAARRCAASVPARIAVIPLSDAIRIHKAGACLPSFRMTARVAPNSWRSHARFRHLGCRASRPGASARVSIAGRGLDRAPWRPLHCSRRRHREPRRRLVAAAHCHRRVPDARAGARLVRIVRLCRSASRAAAGGAAAPPRPRRRGAGLAARRMRLAAQPERTFMADFSSFPITRRWPPKYPDRLQLYSLPTPNGVKVSIALEEMGLAYEPHLVDIGKNESWTPEFLSLNPNGKIPAIIDPDGPGGKPLGLFESGAILLYLAEKTGQLLPADPARRYETIQWVFFQMAAVGPIFGQVGYFHKFAGREIADKRPLERYVGESKRLLGVLETRLAGRQWIMGDEYTIADISLLGWVRNLIGFYEARDLVAFDALKLVPAWLDRGLARPAVRRGLEIPKRT